VRQSWDGATYDDVVAQWGQPQSSSRLADGTNVYLWSWQSPAMSSSGARVGFGLFGGSGGLGTGVGVNVPVGGASSSAPERCDRRMYFREGWLVRQEWQGAPRLCEMFSRR
jgi:hypothetical protein